MKKIVFGLVAVAVLVSACAKNVVPSTEQLRADDQQVIDEQLADEGIPFRAVVSHDNIVKAISESAGEIITKWAEDEEIAMIYSVSGTPYKTVATIASVDGTGKATIEATLQSGVEDGAAVTLIYPASAAIAALKAKNGDLIQTKSEQLKDQVIRDKNGNLWVKKTREDSVDINGQVKMSRSDISAGRARVRRDACTFNLFGVEIDAAQYHRTRK